VAVSVTACPTGIIPGDDNPLIVNPLFVIVASAALYGTLPTFVILSVAVVAVPGVVETTSGSFVTVAASMAGIVNDTLTFCVIAGFVVLVAVTANDTCVPGAGRVVAVGSK
jgi:hypothetical protein